MGVQNHRVLSCAPSRLSLPMPTNERSRVQRFDGAEGPASGRTDIWKAQLLHSFRWLEQHQSDCHNVIEEARI